MTLNYKEFDQSLPDGGWRKLQRYGCCRESAELIREYVQKRERDLSAFENLTLNFHQGQLLAKAGDTSQALRLLERSTDQPYSARLSETWNLFVYGTIAFLKGDRTRLEAIQSRYNEIEKSGKKNPYGMSVISHLIQQLEQGAGYGSCEGQ